MFCVCYIEFLLFIWNNWVYLNLTTGYLSLGKLCFYKFHVFIDLLSFWFRSLGIWNLSVRFVLVWHEHSAFITELRWRISLPYPYQTESPGRIDYIFFKCSFPKHMPIFACATN